MNPDFPCRFLIWSLAVNYTILLAWFFAFAFARGFMRKIHGRWFKLSDQTFSDDSLLRKLAVGAAGTNTTIDILNEMRFSPIELERGSTGFKN